MPDKSGRGHDSTEDPSTVVSRVIDAPRTDVYRSFLDPNAVATWLPPEGMNAHVHRFDPREGGEFRVSLRYQDVADSPDGGGGKTTEDTDTHHGRFVTLVPDERIVEVVEFESDDPGFAGEMRITVTLADVDNFATAVEQLTDVDVVKLTSDQIITHGATAAVDGTLQLASGRAHAFCDVYEFNSHGKNAKIQTMTPYASELIGDEERHRNSRFNERSESVTK